MNDWLDPRLLPEVAVLAVVGYYGLKALSIFKDIVDKMDKEHQASLHELSKAIEKNTESNRELIKASKQQHNFLKNMNGKLTGAVKATIKEHQ